MEIFFFRNGAEQYLANARLKMPVLLTMGMGSSTSVAGCEHDIQRRNFV
jgi:hypothetical protein